MIEEMSDLLVGWLVGWLVGCIHFYIVLQRPVLTCIPQVRGEYDIDEVGNGPEGEWGEGDIDGSLVRQAEERRREKVSLH